MQSFTYKTILLFLSVSIMISCKQESSTPLPVAGEPTFDQTAELDAIVSVIENETSCFFHRDFECWKAHFAHVDYAFQAWNNADGSFNAKVGWIELNKQAEEYIKANPVPPGGSSHPKVERKNMQVKFFNGTLAFLSWDQYNSNPEMNSYTHSLDTRIMEKIAGVWKIVNVTSYWDHANPLPIDSLK